MVSEEHFVHVYLLPLGHEILPSELGLYTSQFSSNENARIANYKYWQDRQRMLLGTALLHWILKKYLDVREVDIARTETGRPFLANADGRWQGDFNLSHSGEWIVAAITNEGRVGVDVEQIGKLNENILLHVLSEQEIISINQLPQEERTMQFYELWTKKESIYKTGLIHNSTWDSINTLSFQSISTDTFYFDERHPISVSWNGSASVLYKPTILTRADLVI